MAHLGDEVVNHGRSGLVHSCPDHFWVCALDNFIVNRGTHPKMKTLNPRHLVTVVTQSVHSLCGHSFFRSTHVFSLHVLKWI